MTFSPNTPNGYLSLCYHYIRDDSAEQSFPRILGTSVDEFEKHIEMFSNYFKLITPSDALFFSNGDYNFKENEIGLLLTFDDGLSDHYTAAKILAKHGIKAIFFIPTCILKDELPANPIILHYCIAKFGLSSFLNFLKSSLEKNLNDFNKHMKKFSYIRGNYDEVIQKIKYFFKYELNEKLAVLREHKEWKCLDKWERLVEDKKNWRMNGLRQVYPRFKVLDSCNEENHTIIEVEIH